MLLGLLHSRPFFFAVVSIKCHAKLSCVVIIESLLCFFTIANNKFIVFEIFLNSLQHQ